MSLEKILTISSSALQAQSQRLNAVASNLANAESAAAPGTAPYRARQVVFQTDPATGTATPGVKVAEVREDSTPARLVYDPKHPYANKDGYVSLSNVNPVDQMVDMIAASRAYQNNVEIMNTAKTLITKTLGLGS